MKKIWYLSTCSTCVRIMDELGINSENFVLYDLKDNPIEKGDLEKIENALDCGYEFLFNKRAMKYGKSGLKGTLVKDDDWKREILKEYTFLKRPIIEVDGEFFVGNAKKVVEACRDKLNE